MRGVLPISSALTEIEDTLELPFVIHKVRARGHLQRKEYEDVERELRLAQVLLPGDIDLALRFVPALEEADRQAAADELFNQVYDVNERVTREFPKAASYHNNLAWVGAKCNRRLDDALEHARAATTLAPQNAAYLDTLAEVHFLRGEREAAIRHMQRCLELDPKNSYFQGQLKRFQAK